MTVTATSTFDLGAYARAFETWDIDALLGFYAEDVELVQIDHGNPPGAPRVQLGKDALKGMFEYGAAAGVTATVENAVAGDGRAAATITCEFPNGRKVTANSILELRDGRIVREHEVVAGDPRGA